MIAILIILLILFLILKIFITLLFVAFGLLPIIDILSIIGTKELVRQGKQTPFSWYLNWLGFKKYSVSWRDMFK